MTTLAAALCQFGCTDKQNARAGQNQIPAVQVVIVPAKRQPVSETLPLVGTVAANEMVEIKSETEGIVEEILFDEGQKVEKGQLLVRLDETKLTASVSESEAHFKLSLANYERAQQLFKDKLVSQQEFDQMASTFSMTQAGLELKRRQLRDARITAPFEGVVGARNISPGQVISRNTALIWLVDLDPVKVEFDVPERFLGQLRIGQTIEIGVAAFPSRKFQGQVFFISPYVHPDTRTALVKAQVANPQYDLRPGMFASLELTLRVREKALVVPEAALIREGAGVRVFVVDQNQTAQLRTVTEGVHLPGWVEITAGLEENEQVIVEGTQKATPGVKVKLAPPEAAAHYQRLGVSEAEKRPE